MYNLMLKLFVKDYKNTTDNSVRQKYGFLSGICGIICNIFLFVLKLTVGTLIGSVAVISDAFNNLSDMGATLVSIVGIKLSSRKPDRDHPFGHGRFEYISALIVSFIIMFVGIELAKSSIEKILHPSAIADINWISIGILCISLPVKFFMYGYNKKFGKMIDSQPLLATAADSLNDCLATGAVIVCTILDGLKLLPFALDGFVGTGVSLLILYAGFSVAKDTIGLLLGSAPDEEFVKELGQRITSCDEIIDIHDLIVHDYGPGRLFASVHAEVDDKADIVAAHEMIDFIEKDIYNTMGCELTIHMDPISTNNPLLDQVKDVLKSLCESNKFSFHDVRMTDGDENINIIFDIVVSFELNDHQTSELKNLITSKIKQLDSRYSVVIQVDRDYSNFVK